MNTASALLLTAFFPVQAEVLINEIMQNPAAVDDSSGEWFEIWNRSAAPVDINGWTIRDNDTDSHLIVNGGLFVIPARGYIVLGINGDIATNGGAPVDYVYSNFVLDNGYDEVVILDNLMVEVHRIEYDDGLTFPDPDGASMQHFWLGDHTIGGNWIAHDNTPYGDGDSGTPGAPNPRPKMDIIPIFKNGFEGDSP